MSFIEAMKIMDHSAKIISSIFREQIMRCDSGHGYLSWIEFTDSYIEKLGNYDGLNMISNNDLNSYSLGFESASGWSIAAYSDKSSAFEFSGIPNQQVEWNRLLLRYRWK